MKHFGEWVHGESEKLTVRGTDVIVVYISGHLNVIRLIYHWGKEPRTGYLRTSSFMTFMRFLPAPGLATGTFRLIRHVVLLIEVHPCVSAPDSGGRLMA